MQRYSTDQKQSSSKTVQRHNLLYELRVEYLYDALYGLADAHDCSSLSDEVVVECSVANGNHHAKANAL